MSIDYVLNILILIINCLRFCRRSLKKFHLFQVPVMLKRLHELKAELEQEKDHKSCPTSVIERPFAVFGEESESKTNGSLNKPASIVDNAGDIGNKESNTVNKSPPSEDVSPSTTPDTKPVKKDKHMIMKRALSPSYYREEYFKYKKPRTHEDSISMYFVHRQSFHLCIY